MDISQMEFHSVGWIYPTLGGIERRSQTQAPRNVTEFHRKQGTVIRVQ